MRRRRIFDIDRVARPESKRLRRLLAHYVVWTEVFGYLFVTIVAAAIITCWFYKVDEVAVEKDIGKSKIKPAATPITHDREAVVTGALVGDWSTVRKGDPVLEVCADENYVERFDAMEQLRTLVDKWQAQADESRLPADLQADLADAQAQLAAWDDSERHAGPRTVLSAPADGVVGKISDLEWHKFAADAAITDVLDFDDLRIDVKLSGKNVERVRVGVAATINVQPKYGDGPLVRVDARSSWWQTRRVQFNSILTDDELEPLVLEHLKDQVIATKEDIRRGVTMLPTDVKDLEIVCQVQADLTTGGAAAESGLTAEDLSQMVDIPGEVVSGEHTAVVKTNVLTDSLRKELTDRLSAPLKGSVVRVPEEVNVRKRREPIDSSLGDERLRLGDISKLQLFTKLGGEVEDLDKLAMERAAARLQQGEAPADDLDQQVADAIRESTGSTAREPRLSREERRLDRMLVDSAPWWRRLRHQWDEEQRKQAENALEVEKAERYFVGVVRIENPPAALTAAVERLAKQDPPVYLQAKVRAVVDQRPLAMLLFRQ